jgi:hypothetical protein
MMRGLKAYAFHDHPANIDAERALMLRDRPDDEGTEGFSTPRATCRRRQVEGPPR